MTEEKLEEISIRAGERTEREPYKQFMFHFEGRDSIDARNINEEEWRFIKDRFRKRQLNSYNCKTIVKMYKIWYPELLF